MEFRGSPSRDAIQLPGVREFGLGSRAAAPPSSSRPTILRTATCIDSLLTEAKPARCFRPASNFGILRTHPRKSPGSYNFHSARVQGRKCRIIDFLHTCLSAIGVFMAGIPAKHSSARTAEQELNAIPLRGARFFLPLESCGDPNDKVILPLPGHVPLRPYL